MVSHCADNVIDNRQITQIVIDLNLTVISFIIWSVSCSTWSICTCFKCDPHHTLYFLYHRTARCLMAAARPVSCALMTTSWWRARSWRWNAILAGRLRPRSVWEVMALLCVSCVKEVRTKVVSWEDQSEQFAGCRQPISMQLIYFVRC